MEGMSFIGKQNLVYVFVTFLLSVLLLSFLYIYNGFPLMMPDTISFLDCAVRAKESSHRSNMYIFFLMLIIRIFSSIKFVAVIQNILVVTVLFIFTKTYVRNLNNRILLGVIIALLFTTLPWFSNLLMGDIFTPVTLLCLILILDNRVDKIFYFILFPILLLGISSHQSHLLIVPSFTFLILLYKYANDRKIKRALVGLVMILAVFSISNLVEKNVLNKKIKTAETIEKESNPDISSGYYFVAVRIAESGQLNSILDHFCINHSHNYICEKTDREGIARVRNSAISKRNSNNNEYVKYSTDNKEFVLYSLRRPEFYFGIGKLIFTRGFAALTNSRLRSYDKVTNSKLGWIIEQISPNDYKLHQNSYQEKNVYPYLINAIYHDIDKVWWYVVLPLLIIVLIYLNLKYKDSFSLNYKHIIFFLICGHIINTLVCGTFSNFENRRYNTRTLWLINLAVILIWVQILQFFAGRKKNISG